MKLLTFVLLLTALALPVASSAQGSPNSSDARQDPGDRPLTRDTLSQSDLKRLAEQMDQWTRTERNGTVIPRVAKARTAAMLKVLTVPCEVSEAAYRGTASDRADQHVYEAACKDGMGYLLLLQGSSLRGVSCLAAGNEEPPAKCLLPVNSDSKVMAGSVLARNDIACNVREVQWLGVNAANLEHVQVACESGGGHVLRSPQPGSTGKTDVIGCDEAVKMGVVCKLSAQAPPVAAANADSRPSLEWFKGALSRNGVSCDTKRARIVGRESIKRRYLVEFECSDRPDGLVAFVPSADDLVNKFESMNCALAAGRGIRCELNAKP
jgi:hypothetical protein